MTSIGNDIVSLDAIDRERTQQQAFYSKILTSSEIELYSRKGSPALPFEHFLWLLWSVKESVYKYMKRVSPLLSFSPLKIIVEDIESLIDPSPVLPGEGELDLGSGETAFAGYRCIASFDAALFTTGSAVNSTFISTQVTHAPSADSKEGRIWWGLRRIQHTDYEHQSKGLRLFVLDKLQCFFPGDRLRIEKAAAGYPVLLRNSTSLDLPISFSHHHDLIFYSFLW